MRWSTDGVTSLANQNAATQHPAKPPGTPHISPPGLFIHQPNYLSHVPYLPGLSLKHSQPLSPQDLNQIFRHHTQTPYLYQIRVSFKMQTTRPPTHQPAGPANPGPGTPDPNDIRAMETMRARLRTVVQSIEHLFMQFHGRASKGELMDW